MEQLLQKMARQLDALDENSLTLLWEKYAGIVGRFEPSERWQEAVLIFSFIQAKRWKNQLFNSKWAARSKQARQHDPDLAPPPPSFSLEQPQNEAPRKAQVLSFSPAPNKNKDQEED